MKQLVFKTLKFFLITFLFLFTQLGLSQIKIPEKPSFIPPIIDSTKTLSESEIKVLYDKLRVYSDSTSTEIFVMIVPSTQGEEIARYATDLGQKWQIGQKGKDNGIIFLISKNDRKMTIQTGYGTEHLLTDALSRRIIELVVKPSFKENRYFEGIDNGTNAIFKIMKGEYKNDKKKSNEGYGSLLFFLIIFIVIFFIAFKNKGGGNSGNNSGGGPSLLDIIILSNMGRSSGGGSFGGGFGGSSGGGFGGFGGGGSFGGGGASGDW